MEPIIVTKAEFKDNSIIFWANNARYQIPSRMFPVSQKSRILHLTEANTEHFTSEIVSSIVDSMEFEMRRCYQNSDKICSALNAAGFDVEFYAGWVFLGRSIPLHHAWVVLRHEKGLSVIDSFMYHAVTKAAKGCPRSSENDNWRKECAGSIRRLEEVMPNHEKIIIGKAPPKFIYTGSPDTADNAKRIFNEVMLRYLTHPSYVAKDSKARGASLLQQELLRQKYNL